MKKALLTAGFLAVLAVAPVWAQDYDRGDRRADRGGQQTIVQGTVQGVNGSILVLQLPNYAPEPGQQYGPPGPVLQIDISEAVYENPDGSEAGAQGLAPGERIVVLTRPAAQGAGNPNPQYGGGYNQQYNNQYPQAAGSATMRARVIEPLNM